MRILVTGATGFLGRTLLSLEGEAEWMGCGRRPAAEGIPYRQVDLADRQAVATLVAELAPDWVINAAAMTDVDGCEKDARAARQANVDIPENLAVACDAAGAGLVHISTDYVFDGKRGPYREGDTTNPLSCYGQLKLESEGILKKMERVLVVRTLWLYGYVPQAGPISSLGCCEGCLAASRYGFLPTSGVTRPTSAIWPAPWCPCAAKRRGACCTQAARPL